MRLDHLLSKEEEVGVVLLSSCQGVMHKELARTADVLAQGAVTRQRLI